MHAWFSLQTVEHGFPHQPSALGYSPSLRILAIGTRSGAVKLYPFCPPGSHPGRPWKGWGPWPWVRFEKRLLHCPYKKKLQMSPLVPGTLQVPS